MAEVKDEILEKVQESLKGTEYECTSFTKLSGGTANFVYRGILKTPLEDGAKTVVIKHTEDYVASNKSFKLTATRCEYEQAILSAMNTFPPVEKNNTKIQTPHLYNFTPSTNTQIQSDLPSSLDLKTYCLTHSLSRPDCQRIGSALGLWTRKFHDWAQAPEQKELREKMKGNQAMKDLKFALNYKNLVATIERFPDVLEKSRGTFEGVRDKVEEEMDGDEGVLIHGDFWSGNVLLPDAPLPEPGTPLQLYIIDWELSHLSTPAFDLGQMFAELYELTYFKSIPAGEWLIESFMEGYGGIEERLARRVLVATGAHLICFGSMVQGWGSEEMVGGVVGKGRELICWGWEREKGEGEEIGVWGCLFK